MPGFARRTNTAASQRRRLPPRAGLRPAILAGWLGGVLASSAAGLAFAPAARAEDKPKEAGPVGVEGPALDIDRARALAKQANRALQKAQSYAEALDYATRAEALYHAPIHLAMIGEALMGMGRLAEAMDTFERLASEPLPATASQAFRSAQEDGRRRLKELTARVPSLLLRVSGPTESAVTATVDGKPFALSGGTATRLDPGVHKIHTVAPGFTPFDRTVTLPAKGGVVVVEVVFEVPAAGGGGGGDKRSAVDEVPTALSRAPWIAALVVGGAGLLVGGIAGGIFVSRLDALKARCPAKRCAPADRAEAQSIGTLGNLSTAGLVVGGAGVATGAVLLLVQRLSGKPPRDAGPARAAENGAPGVEIGLAPFGVGARGWF